MSEDYPFDPGRAASTYEGEGPTVYAYLVLRSENPQDPTVGRVDLDCKIETRGATLSNRGFETLPPWREGGDPYHPRSFLAEEPVDCSRSRAVGYWEIHLDEGHASTVTVTLEADTTAGHWQAMAWDGSGSVIPAHLVAGAAINSDPPPAKVYPFWEFVPVEGRFPPGDGPVVEWLEENGPRPFPVSGIYSWSNLRMGMVNIKGRLGGWHHIPMHMMPMSDGVLFLDEPSFWLRGPQLNGHAPIYRLELPSMDITNLGFLGTTFPGVNSRDYVVSNGAEAEAEYFDDAGQPHKLQVTAAFARCGESVLYVLGWMPSTVVFDGSAHGGRLLYDTYDLRGKLIHRTATDLVGYPLGTEITEDGTLVAVIREIAKDPKSTRSVLKNTRRESVIRITPDEGMNYRVLRDAWAPMELLDYAYNRIVVKNLDLIIILDAESLRDMSRFLFPWERFGREPGLVHSAELLSKSHLLVSTYGRQGEPSDPSERLQLVAALSIRGEPLVEYCDGPGLRKPETPWAYQTNWPTLVDLGNGLLARVADGVGMVLYREFGSP